MQLRKIKIWKRDSVTWREKENVYYISIKSLREKRPLAQNSATQKFLSWLKVKGLMSLCRGISLVKGKIDMQVQGQRPGGWYLPSRYRRGYRRRYSKRYSAVSEDAPGKALPNGEAFSMDASGFSNISVINAQR